MQLCFCGHGGSANSAKGNERKQRGYRYLQWLLNGPREAAQTFSPKRWGAEKANRIVHVRLELGAALQFVKAGQWVALCKKWDQKLMDTKRGGLNGGFAQHGASCAHASGQMDKSVHCGHREASNGRLLIVEQVPLFLPSHKVLVSCRLANFSTGLLSLTTSDRHHKRRPGDLEGMVESTLPERLEAQLLPDSNILLVFARVHVARPLMELDYKGDSFRIIRQMRTM